MMNALLAVLSVLTVSAFAAPLHAQGYPTKPIRLVVPYPAGGATDLVARLATASMADALGQPIVVENRAGAAGVTGMEAVAKGNALNYASAGAGSSGHLTVELFKLTVGIDLTPIHYKGGGPAINDMLGGQVDLMFTPVGFATPHVKSGKLIGLAVTSTRRTSQLPDVPAIAESYAGFEAQAWIGLLAPAGTPSAIVARLNAEVLKSLARTDVKEKLTGQGYEIVGGTPDAFGEWIRAESIKWGRVIRERGITLD